MKNFNAVRFLYPDAIFSMIDDDVEQITWVGQEYPVPTEDQLKNAIAAIEEEEATKLANAAAAKESAMAKLAALGLSSEEISAITNN